MNTLKSMETKFQRPGMLVAIKSENWNTTSFRPKESEILKTLMEHNQQSHVFDHSQVRKEFHSLYYFNKEDTKLLLDKIENNRKLKLQDLMLESLAIAAKKLGIDENILHIDLQSKKNESNQEDKLDKTGIIAYDLGKLHRRKLESNVQLSMIPPLYESKLSVSFLIFADKLSLAVNGSDESKDFLLEMWIREINFKLFA